MEQASRKEAPSSSSVGGEGLLAGVAEISPNKRYIRFEEMIVQSNNSSSIQLSYRAFDTKNGIELAWHTISLNALSEQEQKQITQCVNIVKNVDNKNIIEYLACWFGSETRTLNIITTHLDTLKDFISKVMTLRWRIVKKWCKQILRALDHLHTCKPEIVHRNITCSHVYIDGGVGSTNIGDLWMAAVLNADDPYNPIGLSQALTQRLGKYSPTSTAPEVFEGRPLTTKVDIYSFGMCVLEIISREEPYCEYRGGDAALWHSKIRYCAMKGVQPRVLRSITHTQAKEFILACFRPVNERPTAAELLQHDFLATLQEDDEEVVLREAVEPVDTVDDINNRVDFTSPEFLAFCAAKNDAVTGNGGHDHMGSSDALRHGGAGSALHAGSADRRGSQQPDSFSHAINGGAGYDHAAMSGHTSSQAADVGSDLALELAHFEQGENVHQDKGVHDGRRAEDEVNSEEPSPPPPQPQIIPPQPQLPAPNPLPPPAPAQPICIEESHITLLSLQRSPQCDHELLIKVKIPHVQFANSTNELVSKEVEFAFDLLKDKSETVAGEMITELGLNLAVFDLACQIQSFITDSNIAPLPELTESQAAEGAAKVRENEAGGETGQTAAAVINTAANTSTSNNSPPAPAETNDTPTSPPIDASGAALTDPAAAAVAAAAAPPAPPTSSISPEFELALEEEYGKLDEAEVEKEIEKVDKESRVSRRAFEQRIEKHKIIQEKCDEDLLRLEADYQLKRADLQRKEEAAIKKRADEMARIHQETEAALEKWREKRRSRERRS